MGPLRTHIIVRTVCKFRTARTCGSNGRRRSRQAVLIVLESTPAPGNGLRVRAGRQTGIPRPCRRARPVHVHVKTWLGAFRCGRWRGNVLSVYYHRYLWRDRHWCYSALLNLYVWLPRHRGRSLPRPRTGARRRNRCGRWLGLLLRLRCRDPNWNWSPRSPRLRASRKRRGTVGLCTGYWVTGVD